MLQSYVIEIAGIFAGAAIRIAESYRFIAVDPRVRALDRSEWPSLHAIRRAARGAIRSSDRSVMFEAIE